MTRYRLRIPGVTVATLDVTAADSSPELRDIVTVVGSQAEQAAPYDDGRQDQWQYEDSGIGFRA